MEQELGPVLDEIRSQLQPYNTNGVSLTADTEISADLNIDSVAIMDLLMAIEDKYDISVPINQLADVRTIGDLARVVCDTIGRESTSSHDDLGSEAGDGPVR